MGKRRKYQWGRFETMKHLEVGEYRVVGTGDDKDYLSFRSEGQQLKRNFGVCYSFHYDKATQQIWAKRTV